MKYSRVIVSGAAILTSSSALAGEQPVAVKDLDRMGINHKLVSNVFKFNRGINLNPNEIIRVDRDEEGKNFRFETLDHHSIVVPVELAAGPFNKRSL